MMTYQIIESDVRLLRRILVALKLGDHKAADIIIAYLRNKGLKFKLPNEQTDKERAGYTARLSENEIWLAEKYGCILLPTYADCIFLNSKWRNPYTLFVRLTDEVLELGELGKIYWVSDLLGDGHKFRADAELAHNEYKARDTVAQSKPPVIKVEVSDGSKIDEPWYKRWFGWFGG